MRLETGKNRLPDKLHVSSPAERAVVYDHARTMVDWMRHKRDMGEAPIGMPWYPISIEVQESVLSPKQAQPLDKIRQKGERLELPFDVAQLAVSGALLALENDEVQDRLTKLHRERVLNVHNEGNDPAGVESELTAARESLQEAALQFIDPTEPQAA